MPAKIPLTPIAHLGEIETHLKQLAIEESIAFDLTKYGSRSFPAIATHAVLANPNLTDRRFSVDMSEDRRSDDLPPLLHMTVKRLS